MVIVGHLQRHLISGHTHDKEYSFHNRFLKWVHKSPWVSTLKWSTDLDDLGYLHHLRNLHLSTSWSVAALHSFPGAPHALSEHGASAQRLVSVCTNMIQQVLNKWGIPRTFPWKMHDARHGCHRCHQGWSSVFYPFSPFTVLTPNGSSAWPTDQPRRSNALSIPSSSPAERSGSEVVDSALIAICTSDFCGVPHSFIGILPIVSLGFYMILWNLTPFL